MFGQQEQRGIRRAHSPDSYETSHYRQQQAQQPGRGHWQQGGYGHHGGGYGHQNKRYRGEFQQPLTIEEKIARIGETGSRNSDIESLSKEIESDLINRGQDEAKIKSLTTKICRCIVSFPSRVGAYATLIGFISVKHYNVACQIINTLHASYPVYLEAQRWQESLTIIHLLSSLVNCRVIRPSALLSQFEFLLETTLEENIPQARSDYFVYTVLSSLPYVAYELNQEETKEAFEKILKTIETYLDKRSKEHLNVIRVWISSESTVQMDYLDSLWIQMKNFKANNYVETFLHRPYYDKGAKDIMASSLIPTNSPTFQVPAHSDKYKYPNPKIVFHLFEDDIVEGIDRAIPGSDKIERFCVENHIRNLMDEMPNDTRDCARHLIYMYRSDTLPMKHILIETVLGELFALPQPKHNEILYHSLLYECTKIFHPSRNTEEMKNNYDVVLNEAIKILYQNLDSMNVTCISRFVRWLSFHLNNTEFVYPWQTWSDATNMERTSPKAVFVQDILERCIRFSFHKKIGTILNGNLTDLMPPEVSVQYKPVFEDNPSAKELETTVRKLIIEKADGKTICETLNIIVDGVELPEGFTLRDEKLTEKLLKIDIFTAVILTIASRSLTHLSSAIGKYRNVFKALVQLQGGQVQLLHTMHSCLEKHPQLQVILVDKLLKAELVGANEVCNWLFSDSMKPYHCKSYTWELLNNTISRLQQMVDKLKIERSDLKEDDAEATSKAEAAAASKARPTTPTPTDGDGDDASESQTGKDVGDVEMEDVKEVDEVQRKVNVKEEQERLDDRIASAEAEVERFLLYIFRKLSDVVNNHIRLCESENKSFIDDYYKWTTGRLQEIYYNNLGLIKEFNAVKDIVNGVPSLGNSIINLNQ